MSIHKSKGLEFPVVFLCGTGKKFNLQDLNNPVLLHQDIGFGLKYIDPDRRIEYDTYTKTAIKIKSKKETISEEMRVLYVALTRAKEKLVITGLSKDFRKSMNDKEQLLTMYKRGDNKIDHRLIEKYNSYLDWLELVYLNNKDSIEQIVNLKQSKKKDIIENIQKEEKQKVDVEEILKSKENTINKELAKEINQKLKWQYEYIESSKIPTKTSVTKLKQMESQDNGISMDIDDLIEENKEVKLVASPKFLEEQKWLTPVQKGTLMHLCVQKLDERQNYTYEDLQQFVQNLYEKQIISEIEKKSVNVKVLYEYTKSELFSELKQAKEIHKEEPFYININAKDIYENADEKEKLLVQGIIDLYFIDKNDKVILVDFKTDRIHKGEEKLLEEKYKVQLDLYKRALEEALDRKVDKATIYVLS